MVNLLLLILGCIMDMAPLILICTPILLPALIREMEPLLRASLPKTCVLDFHL